MLDKRNSTFKESTCCFLSTMHEGTCYKLYSPSYVAIVQQLVSLTSTYPAVALEALLAVAMVAADGVLAVCQGGAPGRCPVPGRLRLTLVNVVTILAITMETTQALADVRTVGVGADCIFWKK